MNAQPELTLTLADRKTGSATIFVPKPKDEVVATDEPYRQPGRDELVPITAHFSPKVRRQIKGLAFEQDRTMHDLIAEAFDDLFRSMGRRRSHEAHYDRQRL